MGMGEELVHGTRVGAIGVRVVGREQDVVVAQSLDGLVEQLFVALRRDEAVALEVIEGVALEPAGLLPADRLQVLLDIAS